MAEKTEMDELLFRSSRNEGFKDDGREVDPRTGNEIPPGSLDQEVSDTVDAKLSEGEYVLPADVVRFIGLGQIESLVQQAKRGLAQMESNGRIGGESVDDDGIPTGEDEELTPEEMAMLEEALSAEEEQTPETIGMAQGGAVARLQQAQAGKSPFNLDSMKTYYNPETGELRSFPEGTKPPKGFEETTSTTDESGETTFGLKGDRQGAGGPIGTSPATADTPGVMGDIASVVGPAVDATIGSVAEKAAGAVSSMADTFSGREESNMSASEVADAASKDSESKDSGPESESSGSESGDSGGGGGEGGPEGPSDGDGEGDSEGGQGFPKGGLVKKRPTNKRKKPYKKKKKYGLGTRP